MQGARWVQSTLLDGKPDAQLRVYGIFFEAVAGDRGAKSEVDPATLLDDPRVTMYWDEGKVAGRWFDEHVTKLGKRERMDHRIEWDAWILYRAGVTWSDDKPPRASGWGRPLIQEKTRLLQRVEAALDRQPSQP